MSVRKKMFLGCCVCLITFFATSIGIMAYSTGYAYDSAVPGVEPYMAVLAALLAGSAGVAIVVKRRCFTK